MVDFTIDYCIMTYVNVLINVDKRNSCIYLKYRYKHILDKVIESNTPIAKPQAFVSVNNSVIIIL